MHAATTGDADGRSETQTDDALAEQAGQSSAGVTGSPAPTSREEAYFGVAPSRFIDDACIVIEDYISDAVEVVDAQVKKELNASNVRENELSACTAALLQKFKRSCDENFDRFEIYLKRNVLVVPDTVAVPTKPAPDHSKTQEAAAKPADDVAIGSEGLTAQLALDEARFDQDLEDVEREIALAMRENARLRAELDSAEKCVSVGKENLAAIGFCGPSQAGDEEPGIDHDALANIFKRARQLEEAVAEGKAALAAIAVPEARTPLSQIGNTRSRNLKMDDAALGSVKRLNARLQLAGDAVAGPAPTAQQQQP